MDHHHHTQDIHNSGGGGMSSAPSPASFPHHFHGHRHMMMHMTFYWGTDAIVLFERWPGTSIKMYVLSLLLTFALCLFVEFLSHCHLIRSRNTNQAVAHAIKTIMHGVRMGIAYMAMLAVMSFNVGVLIAAVAGHGFGFLLFATTTSNSKSKESGGNRTVTTTSDLPAMSC